MSKRRRFLATSAVLSLGFVGIQFLGDINRFWAIGVLGITTVVLFYWSLKETIGLNMTLLTLILPFIFTIGVGTFWFLLPSNVYARIPTILFYGIGIYVLALTMNIFTVSATRTIALLRAARGVGFVVSLVTVFLIFDAILSLKAELYLILPLTVIIIFPMFLQAFWFVSLEKKIQTNLIIISFVSSLCMVELCLVLYFWPVTIVVGSLFFTLSYYVLVGLGQAYLEGRLFWTVIKEHVNVGVLVFLAMLLATHWG